MMLCLNCLEPHTHRATPVGHATGSQRDPVRAELSLCPRCAEALIDGNLELFHESYTRERRIGR